MKLFKSHNIYVRLLMNEMEVKNLNTQKTVRRSSNKSFSNDRLLIADYSAMEAFLRQLIKETSDWKFRLRPTLNILIQPIHENIDQYTPVELRTFLDSAEHAGGKQIFIYQKKALLTDQQVLDIIRRGNGKFNP